eukprot:452504-Amphidinium_carterae.1
MLELAKKRTPLQVGTKPSQHYNHSCPIAFWGVLTWKICSCKQDTAALLTRLRGSKSSLATACSHVGSITKSVENITRHEVRLNHQKNPERIETTKLTSYCYMSPVPYNFEHSGGKLV